MDPLTLIVLVLAAVSLVGASVAFALLGMRQKALNKFTTVAEDLDRFTQNFDPGDLVYGPHRYHLGRAQMTLQTAKSHYAQGVELLKERKFWKALNKFWLAEDHLANAGREVELAPLRRD